MTERALAGRWDPRGGGVAVGALADAVRGAGRPGAVERGPFALAWAPDASSRSAPAGVLCLLDGTVANAGPLAEELGIAPGTAPEALAAAGWSRWGEQLPARLRGEFVLVAWDGAANRGLVARGGLGQRPLFLVRAGSAVLFASEVRDLLALLPRRPAPDRLAVAHWLARTGLREGRTLHEGITRLEPGSMLVLSGDAATTRRFWAPSYTPPDAWSQTEAADALRAGMRTAVARALQGAQPTGILLSGGFDSGTAAALAAEVAECPPPAYSAVFPDHPEVDESERIAAVRAGLGLGGVTADVRPASPMRAALEFQAEWQTPCVSPNWFVWSPLLRRAAEDGVATLLDGEGGDEVLGCAPYLIADRLRRGRLRAATRLARSLPGMGPTPDPRVVRRALVRFGLRGALPHTLHRALRRWPTRPGGTPAWLAADLAALHRADEDPWAWKRLRAPRWWAGKAHDLIAGSEELGAADQLRREAASAGLRFAHPYRDQELIELALALPPEPAFDAELDRPLARQAMRGTLPDEVRRGTAKPFFNGFLGEALQADLPAIRRLVGSPDAAIRSFVDAEAVISVLDAPASRRRLEWPLDVWRLATLEFWLRAEADPGAIDALVERAAVPV